MSSPSLHSGITLSGITLSSITGSSNTRLDIEWAEQGACRSADPSIFFAPSNGETKAERLRREDAAKAVCQKCPVRPHCLEHAIANDERYGIWGGLTDGERRRLIPVRIGLAHPA
jgi:WhiB family redox-sensing transcriptional regulator